MGRWANLSVENRLRPCLQLDGHPASRRAHHLCNITLMVIKERCRFRVEAIGFGGEDPWRYLHGYPRRL